jgi:hypothetical protein
MYCISSKKSVINTQPFCFHLAKNVACMALQRVTPFLVEESECVSESLQGDSLPVAGTCKTMRKPFHETKKNTNGGRAIQNETTLSLITK